MVVDLNNELVCPKCESRNFELRREATYVYTYQICQNESEEHSMKMKGLPFLFDNREQTDEKEYILCKNCKESYPCRLDKLNNEMSLTIIQKSIRSDYQEKPEFFG